MDRSQAPLDAFFADRLRLVEAYDRAGFYGYHVAEHHATPLGVAPSPGVWLAAIAQRTTRLRFGALVYLLPLYHPLKLLEEICMLDQMSRGRLMLGVGRGISPIELRYYGLDPAQTPAMYQEALEVILRGMACKELTFEGKYYTFRDVPMELRPFQQPHPPLWYGIGREDAVPWAAQRSVNVVGNVTGAKMRPLTDRYRAEWAALGRTRRNAAADGLEPPCRGGGNRNARRWISLAAATTSGGTASWCCGASTTLQLPNPNALFPETFEEAEAEGRAVAGPPDKVRDFLQRDDRRRRPELSAVPLRLRRHRTGRGAALARPVHPAGDAGSARSPRGGNRMTPQYEVFAIRYATRAARRHEHFIGGDPHDGPMPMDYFVWVAKNSERAVVIDIGFTAESGGKRGRSAAARSDRFAGAGRRGRGAGAGRDPDPHALRPRRQFS